MLVPNVAVQDWSLESVVVVVRFVPEQFSVQPMNVDPGSGAAVRVRLGAPAAVWTKRPEQDGVPDCAEAQVICVEPTFGATPGATVTLPVPEPDVPEIVTVRAGA